MLRNNSIIQAEIPNYHGHSDAAKLIRELTMCLIRYCMSMALDSLEFLLEQTFYLIEPTRIFI